MKIKKALKAQGGFTLIEMLIVVAIIAILVSVSIPMVNNNIEKSKNATDNANVRACKTAALLKYSEDGDFGEGVTGSSKSYYDAVKGTIETTKPTTGYGQSKTTPTGSEATGAPKDHVLSVKVVTDATTKKPTITMAWE